MTIHVNIGEAKTRLSQLLAAALRGEEVVLQKAGVPVATLVPKPEALAIEREVVAAKRVANIGFARDKYKHLPPGAFDVPPSMTEEEIEERYQRKFGAPPA
jgi:antitoxin (DNA-binding transcriptional repressor) of toxin-antitoxin stability system